MKALILTALLLTSFAALAGKAFFLYSETTGLTKICYYEYRGDKIAHNIKHYKVCPVTIEVP